MTEWEFSDDEGEHWYRVTADRWETSKGGIIFRTIDEDNEPEVELEWYNSLTNRWWPLRVPEAEGDYLFLPDNGATGVKIRRKPKEPEFVPGWYQCGRTIYWFDTKPTGMEWYTHLTELPEAP